MAEADLTFPYSRSSACSGQFVKVPERPLPDLRRRHLAVVDAEPPSRARPQRRPAN